MSVIIYRILLLLAFLTLLWMQALPAQAAVDVRVLVSWPANPSGDGVASYKVYFGTGANCGPGQSSVFGQVNSPTTSFTGTIALNAPTNYLFCVTALDGAGNEGQASPSVLKLLNPYWSDSFEDTALSNWTQTPAGLNGTMTVSSVQAVTGTRSLRSVYADTSRVSGPTLQREIPTGTEVYARFWIRASPGFSWGSPPTTLGVFGGGTTAPLISLVTSTAVSGAPYFSVQTAKESSYGTEALFQNQGTPSMIGSAWACVETRYKYNTPGVANGIVQLWVGGALKADYQNREFIGTSTSDPAPSNATLSYVRLYNDRGTGDLYIDDLQVSNARLGCAGVTPPDPSVTVIAPTNFAFSTGSSPGTIALDTTSQLTAAFVTNSTTGSITIGAGTNRGLVCAVQSRDPVAADRPVSSFTLGAQGLTYIRRDTMPGDGSATEWWGLINPTSGLGTLTVTTTGVVNGLAGYCIALTGVDQTAMVGTSTGTIDLSGTNASIETTLSNLISGAWVFDTVYTFSEFGLSVGAGQTQHDNRNLLGGGNSATVGVSSVGPLAASVIQPMGWTYTPPAIDKYYTQTLITVVPSAGSASIDILSWVDNSSDETGFVAEWKHDGTGGAFVPLFTVGPNITEYPNPITTQTNVTIRLKAVRGADVSEWIILSTVPPTTPPPDPGDPIVVPPPTTPTSPTPTIPVDTTPSGKLVNGRTVVSWNTPNVTDSTISQYVVEWTNYKLGTSGWQAIGVTAPNATGFVHRYTPFVPAGEPSFWVAYRVKAVTTAGLSSYSDPITGEVDVYVPLSPPSVQIPNAPSAVSLQ